MNLQHSYNQIANEFSRSRSKPWPEFHFFAGFIPEGSKVLDLGCGNGRLYEFLQEKHIDYTGLDFSEELLNIAKEKYPDQEFILQDMTQMELDRRYNVIISIAAFHHLVKQKMRKKTLKLIFDHLEDDGVLLLSVWNLWQWRFWKAHLRAWWRWIASGFREHPRLLNIPFGREKVARHYFAFFSYELKRMLRDAGFRIDASQSGGKNLLFVCGKHMTKGQSHPLFTHQKALFQVLPSGSPAHCHRSI